MKPGVSYKAKLQHAPLIKIVEPRGLQAKGRLPSQDNRPSALPLRVLWLRARLFVSLLFSVWLLC